MTIDIISYTDEQYAVLGKEQLLEIREAQVKKNNLEAKLFADLEKEKRRLIDNGIFFSEIWAKIQDDLELKYERAVEAVREALLFYLRYSSSPDGEIPSAPYTVNYALTLEERMIIVRDYYEDTYTNAAERYEAFKKDQVAKSYLGELYLPLHDYFLNSL